MLDPAIETLKTYQTGADPKLLQPLENALLAARNDAAAAASLETGLVEILRSDVSVAAKDAICRMLRSFGTTTSVPALAELLVDERLSHMARYALERIPAPEAGRALRDSLGNASGRDKIGIITSLGVRAEAESVVPLQALLADPDASIARAAALALGEHGTRDAAKILLAATQRPETLPCVADALLACAGKLAASGDKEAAATVYHKLAGGGFPELAGNAAKRSLQPQSGSGK